MPVVAVPAAIETASAFAARTAVDSVAEKKVMGVVVCLLVLLENACWPFAPPLAVTAQIDR